MSMEEVQDRERELDDMRNAIRDYATLAPIDLFKPSEIQKHLLRIADGEPWQAPEPRIIPDGAHHSGLMKDYGGRYNPDFKAAPTSEAERLKQASEILEDTFVPEELIDAKNDLVTWLNKEAAQQQESSTGEAEYYRSCGECKWRKDTDEDDRYEGRCPKCGGVTLQWAKPPAAQQQESGE